MKGDYRKSLIEGVFKYQWNYNCGYSNTNSGGSSGKLVYHAGKFIVTRIQPINLTINVHGGIQSIKGGDRIIVIIGVVMF